VTKVTFECGGSDIENIGSDDRVDHCRFGIFRMRAVSSLVLALCSVWLFSQPVLADKRVALVIGNSVYQNVARLSNPANDASAMTETLQGAGFDIVESRRDLKTSEMRRALRDFSDRARGADVAVVYYAGHGIEVDGTNYLIPVDAVLERDIDIFDEAFSLDRILVTIEPARQLRLVILDACRDNPFAATMKRINGSRGIGRGLAKVEPASPNTLIAFASKAGSTASDGDSKNSPFTAALVKHIAKPGLDLRKAFGFVRDDVLKNTGNRQEPYVYGSLGGDDVPLVPAKPAASVPTSNPQADIRRDYEFALQLGTREGWAAFLAQFPEGFYANLAKGQLNKIAAEEARIAAAERATIAEQEKARLAAGAKQAGAAAQAKAAEDARIAAEKAGQAEQAKVAAAEQARAAAEKVAANELAAKKIVAETPAAEAPKPDSRVAALPPNDGSDAKTALSAVEIARLTQMELRRVGCLAGSVDGEWNSPSRRALEQFNRNAGTKFDVKVASLDVLDMVKSKTARVCPLICEHGFKADGERCVKISCGANFFLNDDNECEKKRDKPSATRKEAPAPSEKPKQQATQQASGKYICNQQGCREVRKGCRLSGGRFAASLSSSEVERCD
jgi:uncharacterized caspase-like protein